MENLTLNDSEQLRDIKNQIFFLYEEIYNQSLDLRTRQIITIKKNAQKHIEEIKNRANLDFVLSKMKEEEQLLQVELEKVQESTQTKFALIEKLKIEIAPDELQEINNYESRLIAIMESQMGIEIPEVKQLERTLKNAVTKENVNLLPIFILLGTIVGIIIAFIL